MECTEVIERAIENLKLGFKCLPSERRMCIVTPYLYPDNDLVEVFVEEIAPNWIRVTDLGETLRHLESLGVDVLASSKRRFLLEQVTKRLHVNIQRGKLEREGAAEEVGSLLMDVVTAAQGVADLVYTSKAYEPATFPEEVSLFLSDNKIEHERHFPVYGTIMRNGRRKKYWVSLRIDGRRDKGILIEAMSPSQESAMTATVNRVFRMWFDVDETAAKVSLLNDVDYSWKPEDIALLERVSVIQTWSRKERFLEYTRST